MKGGIDGGERRARRTSQPRPLEKRVHPKHRRGAGSGGRRRAGQTMAANDWGHSSRGHAFPSDIFVAVLWVLTGRVHALFPNIK